MLHISPLGLRVLDDRVVELLKGGQVDGDPDDADGIEDDHHEVDPLVGQVSGEANYGRDISRGI